jgi:hypothetical protein
MTSGEYRVTTQIKAIGVNAVSGSPTQSANGNNTSQQSFAYGAGSSLFNQIIVRTVDLNPGVSATYDLYTGTDLPNVLSETAALRAVMSASVYVVSGGDATGVIIGDAATDVWAANFGGTTETATIYPGGPPWQCGKPAGIAVTSSAKNLKIENAGAVAVTVRISICGSSIVAGSLMGALGLTYS